MCPSITPPSHNLNMLLEDAARAGEVGAVREFLNEPGFDLRDGFHAFVCAAEEGHIQVLDVLSQAGVRDTGEALMRAISLKKWDSAVFLFRQYDRFNLNHINNTRTGVSILFKALEYFQDCFSPKLLRWLMDAGANTHARVKLVQPGLPCRFITPRELIDEFKRVDTRQSVPSLYAIDNLLKQEAGVLARDWLWPKDKTGRKSKNTVAVRIVLPTTPHVALSALFKYTRKC